MIMWYRVVGRTHTLYDHVVHGGWKDTHTHTQYMAMWCRVVGRTHKLYDHEVHGGWKDTHKLNDHVVQGS